MEWRRTNRQNIPQFNVRVLLGTCYYSMTVPFRSRLCGAKYTRTRRNESPEIITVKSNFIPFIVGTCPSVSVHIISHGVVEYSARMPYSTHVIVMSCKPSGRGGGNSCPNSLILINRKTYGISTHK